MRAARTGVIASNQFHPGYKAILAAAVTSGYTLPSRDVQVQQNGLYCHLRRLGVITGYDLLYVFTHDGSETFGYINWCNTATFRLTKTGTLTFTSKDGVKGNGSTGYYNTSYSPFSSGVNFSKNSGSFLVNVKENIAEAGLVFGRNDNGSVNHISFNPRSATDTAVMRFNQTTNILAPSNADGSGMFYGERTSNVNLALYREGSSIGSSTTGTSSDTPSGNVLIFCRSAGASGPLDFTTRTIRMFGMGAPLVSSQSELKDVWNTYFNNL